MHAFEHWTETHAEATLLLGMIKKWSEFFVSQDALELLQNRSKVPRSLRYSCCGALLDDRTSRIVYHALTRGRVSC